MELESIRVLLVDDDEDDYVVTRDLLGEIKGARFTLDWRATFDEAREAIACKAHDVYLLDYRLGAHNGLDLLREARALGCQAPIILLTGHGDRDLDLIAMRAGADDFLVKQELKWSLLDRSLRYALARTRLQRERDQLLATARVAQESLRRGNELLAAVGRAQRTFLESGDTHAIFDSLLTNLLELTRSEYGFIGEVRTTTEGKPYLKTHAITNIAWNAEMLALYEAHRATGLEFYNLNTLFGSVMTSGRAVIANDPLHDPRRGGLPAGHPAMRHFMGLPIYFGERLVGLVGIANRPGGYDAALANYLEPLLAACASLIQAYRSDQSRRHAETQLRESEERLRLALEAGELGSFEWDLATGNLTWNDYHAILFGLRPDQFDGRHETFLRCIHPDDLEGIERTTAEARRNRSISRCDYRVVQPDGSLRWIAGRGAFRYDERGEAVRMYGVAMDITERMKSRVALAATNQQLQTALHNLKTAQDHLVRQERLRALGQMASGIAHDFNNALSPILGFTELLLRPGALDEPERVTRFLRLIHTSCLDAANTVARLREFYRTRDEAELFSETDVNALAVEVISMTRPVWKDDAQARGVTIEVRADLQPLPPLRVNASDLRELLTNLIFNAVEAMPQGGIVSVRSYLSEANSTTPAAPGRSGEWLLPAAVLEVRDTGLGMTAGVRDRCLEPFFTTKGLRGGLGMGLAMVYGIVQRHQGTLAIESEPEAGTTVRIELPFTMPAARTPAPPPARIGPAMAPLRILVVDDEALVREVVLELLLPDGHRLESVANGREALDLLEAARFDVIITDKAMPGMSGEQLASEVRARHPQQPIIMLTGYGDFMEVTEAKPPCVDLVLAKPVTYRTLAGALADVLSSRETA